MAASAEWIDLLDPSREELVNRLPPDVHERALDQLLAPLRHEDEPRPKLEGHDGYVFGVFVAPVCVREEDRVYYQEVDLIVTREAVITVRKTPERGEPFDARGLREALRVEGALPAGMIAYYVADQATESFLDLVDALDEEVDELEEGIDTWREPQIRERVARLRHDVLHARRLLGPTRDALHQVVDRRVEVRHGAEIFPRRVELHFGGAYDKALRAADGLELIRELITSARDYHQAKIATEQNEVTKRLTAIASLLLVPTLIVGVYGQNFDHFPELRWSFGYGWSWGLIVVTTLLQLAFFKWRKWI